MYEQVIPLAKCFLSPLLCVFRKGYNTQHALLKFLETCKAAIDNGDFAGALLMDLSKAFDSLNHDYYWQHSMCMALVEVPSCLFTAVFHTENKGPKLMVHIVCGEKQTYVHHKALCLSLCYLTFMCDTLYLCDHEVKTARTKLEQNANHLKTWFPESHKKLNEDNCHLIIFGTREEKVSMHVGEVQIEESDDKKLLGITLDKTLTFKKPVEATCKQASQKLHALTCISICREPKTLKLLMKAYIMSQFSYCSLVWMFHKRNLNNRIHRIHETAPQIEYKDNFPSFENLLLMDNLVTVHQRNLQLLMIEIYKTRNNPNPNVMKQIFEVRVLPYKLRYSEKLQLPKAKTTGLGIDTVRFEEGTVQEMLPHELKKLNSL